MREHPASVSALGSDLLRQADLLHAHREHLARVGARLDGWEGPAAAASGLVWSVRLRVLEDTAEAQRLVDRAVADRDDALRVVRLRTQASAWTLRQVPLRLAAVPAAPHDATHRG